jgi:glutathionyl-hydroquinone reductase
MLWDKKQHTVVNNESSEIIRMFNNAFNALLPPDKAAVDLYPSDLAGEIDKVNDWVYDSVNSSALSLSCASPCR